MARIKHLAIKTTDPERLGNFYAKAFDMKIIHRSPNGGVYVTDGYVTLALLKQRPNDTAPGINHFGFEVDDAKDHARRMVELNVAAPTERPGTTPFAELRGMDPDGNLFDISEHGYVEVEFPAERTEKKAKETAK